MGKVVITYGTFDLPHVGHIRLLKRLKALGDYLIVGVSTDAFNAQKGKVSIYPFEERREIIASIGLVDKVIAEEHWAQKITDIQRYNVDILAMGDDWAGKFDDLSSDVEIVYLPRTEGISTTDIKTVISRVNEDKLLALECAIDQVSRLAKKLR
ncbi:glycerol-3-phosphate cytidylyltransferase [Vreelandella alkaliphila]|uniref:adenylyltransferase/cytidyltransferase family protein n=1 Tax=Vreelandella alkaliphila TaxID=272774 RepID=UPI000EA12425|nr:adenylyltransferase/cytidyltransferase family protein [Halomonas alkaliphila]AYF33938.1 glycerol-3-phosphate cytidylyltransferase [Halomonas alkaliphila]